MAAPAVCTTKFTLNNGTTMPAVGLGTWQGNVGTDDSEALEKSIAHALDSGYRLIDTAHAYGVEAIVGRAVRASKVPRSDICVVTKFWGEWHHDPAEALRMSLAELGLDYVDVLLMHWPWATTPASDGKKPLKIDQSPTIVETWRLMEKLVGPQCRAIGVSNFTQKTLDKLIAECSVVPAVNQVELHALNPNSKLVPYCDSKGIRVMSWSTLGGDRKGQRNPILTHEIFTSIAEAHGCSTGVVSLSWAVQRGVVVIPKSSSPKRIEDNIKLVTLSDDEMHRINTAHEVIGRERMADGIVLLQVQMDGKKTLQGWSAVDFGWEDEQGNWSDVTHYDKLQASFGSIVQDFGRIGGFITAIGVCLDEPFLDRSPASVKRCLEINSLGTYYSAQLAARQMTVQSRLSGATVNTSAGYIITIASIAAHRASKAQYTSDYCMSKGAVLLLTRQLGSELADRGVRVNTISLGYIMTDMTGDLVAMRPDLGEIFKQQLAMGRIGDRTDLKGAAVFLLSNASACMTSGEMLITGGLHVGKVH